MTVVDASFDECALLEGEYMIQNGSSLKQGHIIIMTLFAASPTPRRPSAHIPGCLCELEASGVDVGSAVLVSAVFLQFMLGSSIEIGLRVGLG